MQTPYQCNVSEWFGLKEKTLSQPDLRFHRFCTKTNYLVVSLVAVEGNIRNDRAFFKRTEDNPRVLIDVCLPVE